MIAESCSGGDRPGFEKAVTLQLFWLAVLRRLLCLVKQQHIDGVCLQ